MIYTIAKGRYTHYGENKTYGKKDLLIELTSKYSENPEAYVEFFIKAKFPTGFYCEKCECTHYHSIKRNHVMQCKECIHQHYLFAGTIFQDNKLDLYKLILGLYLFFTSTKEISAMS